ncbi:alpha,alpha-trehalase [Oesophagostomum dentatum]|uniref:Trehalase n=1 Tax=Oesophagostomum dentatum TaxID=61180 RepID=A0A0B1T9S7_OESDE|nr:alpha,alpha-trehalase [Oesophagostomum dentatum]
MIYCGGKLLQAVNAVQLYNDSKTFVDRPMKEGRDGATLTQGVRDKVSATHCELADWSPHPESFDLILDEDLRTFALKLNDIWKNLCREMKQEVKNSPERFSLIYVPHPFIVPGGRFREFYYWDAYWILKGLLKSGMTDTAKNMILNFAYLIDNYGFVPNGGRVYYLRRSQPPMFIPIVYDYYLATKDKDFVLDMLPLMEKEIQFWMDNRSVNITMDGVSFNMYQYRASSTVPRPESYRQDVITAENATDDNEKLLLYQNIASAAEAGWDFSTRWFADKESLASVETTNILPVDLNAFICYNLHILGNLHGEVGKFSTVLFSPSNCEVNCSLGNEQKSNTWITEYIKFRGRFEKVFYVEEAKGWYDYNLRSKKHNTEFYASMAAPLYTQCYDPLSTSKTDDLYNKLEEMGVFNFTGGIPTR